MLLQVLTQSACLANLFELDFYGQLDSPIDLLDLKLLITAACPECINNQEPQALEFRHSSSISREVKCLPNDSYKKSFNFNNEMYGAYCARSKLVTNLWIRPSCDVNDIHMTLLDMHRTCQAVSTTRCSLEMAFRRSSSAIVGKTKEERFLRELRHPISFFRSFDCIPVISIDSALSMIHLLDFPTAI